MQTLKFDVKAKIVLKEASDKYLNIQPHQLSTEILDMLAKQIYVGMDKILSVVITASSVDPENSILISTVCWDGNTVQRIIGKHTIAGDYERISVDFM